MEKVGTLTLPCPCEVGPGRKLAVDDINMLLEAHISASKMPLKVAGIIGCTHVTVNGKVMGGKWCLDFHSSATEGRIDSETTETVQKLMADLNGQIDGVADKFIRTSVEIHHDISEIGRHSILADVSNRHQ